MAESGRPREFDVDEALDKAVGVFWRQGYEATTLDDLTNAMQIARTSLYHAFGNKEATFRRAVERYAQTRMGYLDEAIGLPTARAVAEHYLRSNLMAVTARGGDPAGCLTIQGGLAAGAADQGVVQFLGDCRAGAEARLAERFRAAAAQGDLPPDEQPAHLAKYLFTVAAGLAVQARAGASRADLASVVERTLSAFPG